MSIANYSELQAAVISWVNHAAANSRVTDFISLAEAEISADLEVKAMDIEQSVAFSSGAASITLPVNVINPRSFKLAGARYPDVEIVSSDALSLLAIDQYPRSADKTYGALVGRTLKLFPAQSASGSITVNAKCAIPPLSVSNVTNWLLTSFPNVYLFAAIRETGSFMRDANMIEWAEGRYQQAIAKVNGQFIYKGQMARSVVHGVR